MALHKNINFGRFSFHMWNVIADIRPYLLDLRSDDPYDAAYLFVVERLEGYSLYAATSVISHDNVVRRYCRDPSDIIGGGSLYMIADELYLGDHSARYGAVQPQVLEGFVPRLESIIRKQRRLKSVVVNPTMERILSSS